MGRVDGDVVSSRPNPSNNREKPKWVSEEVPFLKWDYRNDSPHEADLGRGDEEVEFGVWESFGESGKQGRREEHVSYSLVDPQDQH
jgi:hypothetical protein